ncbi:MAG: integrin alpha [Phycisphaerales bacterium]
MRTSIQVCFATIAATGIFGLCASDAGAQVQWIEFHEAGLESVARYAFAIAGIPDTDGDGMGDVVVGASEEDVLREDGTRCGGCGIAYVYSGSTGALRFTLAPPGLPNGAHLGHSARGIPDVNGDGAGDILVGSYIASTVWVFSGSDGALLDTLTGATAFGYSIGTIPDIDRDGVTDFVVGAIYSSGYRGRAYVYSGATRTLLHEIFIPELPSTSYFGWSVAGTDDLDGDGAGDVLIGAPEYRFSLVNGELGRAFLFSGATGTLLRTIDAPDFRRGSSGSK